MAKLKDIFNLLHYKTLSEQVAFTRLIAYCGGFNQPDYYLSEEKNIDSLHYKRREKFVKQSYPIWRQTQLKKYYNEHKNQIISRAEAIELLNTNIHSSLALSLIWFSNTLNIYFLRKEFEYEGILNEKLHDANQDRWIQKDKIEIKLLEKEVEESCIHQLYQCANDLHLIKESPWPSDIKFSHVILQCSIDQHTTKCIQFLIPEEYDLYLFSGPRGAFNFEETISFVLAEWFNMPDKLHVIQDFLKSHQNKDDPLQWYKNLSGLKKGLMEKLEAKEWPQALNSYYYYPGHKEIYDLTAKKAGRQYLDCEGGPWPVSADLAYFRLKEHFNNDPIILSKIKIIPFISMGKNGRLPTMDDLLEKWFNEEGAKPIERGHPILMIGRNSKHFIRKIEYHLLYNNNYQKIMRRQHLQHKINKFNAISENKSTKLLLATSQQFYAAGPAAEFFSFYLTLDSLATSIFPVRKHIKNTVDYYQSVEEDLFASQMSFVADITLVKRMVFYHQHNEYMFLADTVVDLAFHFYTQNDLVKTAGLFNFALNVLEKIQNTRIKNLTESLYLSTLINIQQFVLMISKKLSCKNKNINLDMLKLSDEINREKLNNIREEIFRKFKSISPINSNHILSIYQLIFNKMKAFYLSFAEQSQEILGRKVNDMAYAYMGSYSRLQATPYSDIESCIIINDESDFEYTKYLTQLILMKIFQLRETVLSALGIFVNDNKGNLFDLSSKIYDDYTKYGFSFDQNLPQACKTPLGKNLFGIVYRLIGTPETLVQQFSAKNGFQWSQNFPQLIHLTRFAGGNKLLYKRFVSCLQKNTALHPLAYSFILLNSDLEKYINCLGEIKDKFIIDHKKYFFSPINIFLDDVLIALLPTKNMNSHKKIDTLYRLNIIDYYQRNQLIEILNYVLYLRLHQHYKFKKQKIYIKKTESIFPFFYSSQQKIQSLMFNTLDTMREKEVISIKKEYTYSCIYNLRMLKPFIKITKESADEKASSKVSFKHRNIN